MSNKFETLADNEMCSELVEKLAGYGIDHESWGFDWDECVGSITPMEFARGAYSHGGVVNVIENTKKFEHVRFYECFGTEPKPGLADQMLKTICDHAEQLLDA